MLYLHVFAVLCIFVSARAQYIDYYWRDYYGVVPIDALPGGTDINGSPVYIGQVYIHEYGIGIGELFPGKTEIGTPFGGAIRKQNYLIKILCTRHPQNFYWLKVDGETYKVDTVDKHPVVGGYDHNGNKGVLNVGKIMDNGIALTFGNIAAYEDDTVHLYYPDGDTEKKTTYYEVLIYNTTVIH